MSCCAFAANVVRLQLHALAYNLANFVRTLASARGGQPVVADEPAGKTREDRRQGPVPGPLRDLPDGRSRGAEGMVPGDSAADRRTATKTGSSVGTEGVGCVITTGGVCLNDEEEHQIGFSGMVRAVTNARSRADAACGFRVPRTMLAFTPIPSHLGDVGWRSTDGQGGCDDENIADRGRADRGHRVCGGAGSGAWTPPQVKMPNRDNFIIPYPDRI